MNGLPDESPDDERIRSKNANVVAAIKERRACAPTPRNYYTALGLPAGVIERLQRRSFVYTDLPLQEREAIAEQAYENFMKAKGGTILKPLARYTCHAGHKILLPMGCQYCRNMKKYECKASVLEDMRSRYERQNNQWTRALEEARTRRPPSPTHRREYPVDISRRNLMGPDFVSGLQELEKRMRASGSNPASVRLLICFDN